MKKTIKILSAVLIAFCVLILAASCGAADDGTEKSGEEKGGGDPVVTFNGENIKLDYERNHKDLYYKESLTDLHSDTAGSFRNISCEKDGKNVLNIRLVYFADKSVEEVMSGSDNELTDKTANGITYKYFEYETNGVPGHTYVYNFDGTTYTISFESEYDTASLEEGFLNTVHFEKSE